MLQPNHYEECDGSANDIASKSYFDEAYDNIEYSMFDGDEDVGIKLNTASTSLETEATTESTVKVEWLPLPRNSFIQAEVKSNVPEVHNTISSRVIYPTNVQCFSITEKFGKPIQTMNSIT